MRSIGVSVGGGGENGGWQTIVGRWLLFLVSRSVRQGVVSKHTDRCRREQ